VAGAAAGSAAEDLAVAAVGLEEVSAEVVILEEEDQAAVGSQATDFRG